MRCHVQDGAAHVVLHISSAMSTTDAASCTSLGPGEMTTVAILPSLRRNTIAVEDVLAPPGSAEPYRCGALMRVLVRARGAFPGLSNSGGLHDSSTSWKTGQGRRAGEYPSTKTALARSHTTIFRYLSSLSLLLVALLHHLSVNQQNPPPHATRCFLSTLDHPSE